MIDHSICFYHKSKGIVTTLQALKSTIDTVQVLTPSRWSLLILPLLGLTEKLAYFSLWSFSSVSLACAFSLGSLVTKKHMQWHTSSLSKTVHKNTISKISYYNTRDLCTWTLAQVYYFFLFPYKPWEIVRQESWDIFCQCLSELPAAPQLLLLSEWVTGWPGLLWAYGQTQQKINLGSWLQPNEHALHKKKSRPPSPASLEF